MSRREELLAEAKRHKREQLLEEARGHQAAEAEETAKLEASKPSKTETAIRGGAQGILPFADEAYGAFKAMGHTMYDPVINAGKAIMSDKPLGEAYEEAAAGDKAFGDNYREARDFARKKDAQAQAARPGLYTGANLTGAVASSFVPGMGVLNKGGVVARGLKGAGQGAVTGLGMSDADLTKGQVHEAMADAGQGALVGGLAAGAIAKAEKSLNPKVLKHLAERRAFKAAIGNQGKIYDEAVSMGKVNKIGRDLLDDKVVGFGDNAKAIAKKAYAARKKAGESIGNVLSEVDEAGSAAVNGKAIAEKIRAHAAEIAAPNNEGAVNGLLKQADAFEAMGEIPLQEAQRLKNSYKWKFGENNSMSQEATNTLKGILGDEMEGAVTRAGQAQVARAADVAEELGTGTLGRGVSTTVDDPVASAVSKAGGNLGPEEQQALTAAMKDPSLAKPPGPSPMDRYSAGKEKYGSMDTAAKGSRKLAARQEKNRTFGLTDNMWGGIGLMTMGPKGLALAAGNKLARERGSSAMAVGLDKAAKILEATPEMLGPFAPILSKAAKSGSLPAVHYVLMKNNPEYRDLIEGSK